MTKPFIKQMEHSLSLGKAYFNSTLDIEKHIETMKSTGKETIVKFSKGDLVAMDFDLSRLEYIHRIWTFATHSKATIIATMALDRHEYEHALIQHELIVDHTREVLKLCAMKKNSASNILKKVMNDLKDHQKLIDKQYTVTHKLWVNVLFWEHVHGSSDYHSNVLQGQFNVLSSTVKTTCVLEKEVILQIDKLGKTLPSLAPFYIACAIGGVIMTWITMLLFGD